MRRPTDPQAAGLASFITRLAQLQRSAGCDEDAEQGGRSAVAGVAAPPRSLLPFLLPLAVLRPVVAVLLPRRALRPPHQQLAVGGAAVQLGLGGVEGRNIDGVKMAAEDAAHSAGAGGERGWGGRGGAFSGVR